MMILTDEEYKGIKEAFDEIVERLHTYRLMISRHKDEFSSNEVEAIHECLQYANNTLDQIGYHLTVRKRLRLEETQ